MKGLLLILFSPFVFPFTGILCAQSFEWVRTGSGLGQDAGQRIATDAEGNAYVTGYFSGKAVFSGTLYEGHGVFDIFIAKYSAAGQLLWLKYAGSSQNDIGYGIGIDSQGFIYVTGCFTSVAAFGEEGGLTYVSSSGSTDIFIAKYAPDGNFLWVKKAGGQGEDCAQNLSIDIYDNIFITGYFENRGYFGNYTAISQGSIDAFIACYDTDGNCKWMQSLGGAGVDKSFGLAIDSAGYSYITGFFYYAALPSNSSDTIHAEGLSSDIFICRYSPAGDIVLAKRAGGPYNDAAFGIAVDKDKAMLITGYFLEEIDFGNCQLNNYRYDDVFVVKYDSTFKCEWAHREGGNKLDMGLDIAADQFGNVYVTGIYDSLARFGDRIIASVDYYDLFICKYNAKGILLWTQTAGGTGGDFSKAVSVGNNGAVYLTGYYKSTSIFGSIQAPFGQEADVFLARMSQSVGIAVAGNAASFKIFPNPAAREFFIELDERQQEPLTAAVMDITGKIIFRQLFPFVEGSMLRMTLDAAPGVYLVRVDSPRSGFTASGRVVIF